MENKMIRPTRAGLLPYPGDPFLLNYYLGLYDRVWHSEIDKLYVHLNSPINDEVVQYIETRVLQSPNTVFIRTPQQKEHGWVIKDTLQLISEDNVVLLEDDGFIFKMGAVSQCFNMIESGAFDLVGSKRGSCGAEIYKAQMEHWGLHDLGLGDQGANFWPCFLFASKKILSRIDNFGARAWTKGETVKYINHVLEAEVEAGDTMVEASMQLRSLVPEGRISYVPQYHGHPDDLDHYHQGKYLFDGRAPWCHIGSLSSGVGGILVDDYGRCLARSHIDLPKDNPRILNQPNNDFERREYERRVQWWLTSWENREYGKIDSFADEYKKAIDRLIKQFQLNTDRIRQRQDAYRRIGL